MSPQNTNNAAPATISVPPELLELGIPVEELSALQDTLVGGPELDQLRACLAIFADLSGIAAGATSAEAQSKVALERLESEEGAATAAHVADPTDDVKRGAALAAKDAVLLAVDRHEAAKRAAAEAVEKTSGARRAVESARRVLRCAALRPQASAATLQDDVADAAREALSAWDKLTHAADFISKALAASRAACAERRSLGQPSQDPHPLNALAPMLAMLAERGLHTTRMLHTSHLASIAVTFTGRPSQDALALATLLAQAQPRPEAPYLKDALIKKLAILREVGSLGALEAIETKAQRDEATRVRLEHEAEIYPFLGAQTPSSVPINQRPVAERTTTTRVFDPNTRPPRGDAA